MTENFGALFFIGVKPHERLGFVEKHKQEIEQLYSDRCKAASTWIDGRYIEYRPSVGGFTSVLELPVRIVVDKADQNVIQ